MNNGEIKFKTWRLTSDALVNSNSRIPFDHISQTVFKIEENEYKNLLLFLASILAVLSVGISFVFVFNFYYAGFILLIAALLVYFALQKNAYFKVYSSSGQSIGYYINETNADKLRNDIEMYNLLIDELLERKRDYLNLKNNHN
jgi:hypothetical protein